MRITANQLRNIVKSLLPLRVGRFIRRAHRDFIFHRAMRRFLIAPEVLTQPENPVVIDLIYGWGNDQWSASHEYLAACTEHALTSNGPILECGSGLSTILVGAIAKRGGLSHWALEHILEQASKVQRNLDRYEIDTVVLCAKALKAHDDFTWYDPPLESMPDSFALVVCDGPPGDTEGGRYGLVPIMRERLKPGCVILLDDAHREDELAIAKRWEAELGASFEILGRSNPYVKMTVLGIQSVHSGESPF